MSEKRFKVLPNNVVWDSKLGVVVCRCILEGIGDAETVCQRLNEQQTIIEQSTQKIKNKKKYQQVLEAKIRRLKKRIKVLEK